MNLKKIDLNLLVVFEAIYSAANISHAAKQLGMSQPTVSNALARLRLLMDDPLFVAQRRGVEATVKARQMIAPVREARQHVRKRASANPSLFTRHAWCVHGKAAWTATPSVYFSLRRSKLLIYIQ